MTADKYVNLIVGKIKCSSAKKKEIKKQLLTDIALRVENGEELINVLDEMGSVDEIAESFNENISDEEMKRYQKGMLIKRLVIGSLLLVVISCVVYFVIIRQNKEEDNPFSKKKMDSRVRDVVEKLDNEDYEALMKKSTPEVQEVLNQEMIESAKKMISDNWGRRESFGEIYIQEVIQDDLHYVITQMTVDYENVSVTYTITFDKDLKIAGLYMK